MSSFTQAQREAIAANGNVLVSAGAGTGKTRTVVERCLRLIEEGCSLENILMVTFTEAAAAEMRARLRKELERRRDEDIVALPVPLGSAVQWEATSQDASGQLNLFDDGLIGRAAPRAPGVALESQKIVGLVQATARAERRALPVQDVGDAPRITVLPLDRIEEQLALLDTAHISTLHSFCLQLVQDHFHELHLDPQVSVLDEAQSVPLIHAALDGLLDRCYAGQTDFAEAIQKFIRQHGGSDERVRALVLKLHRYTQSLPSPERWMERELARLEASDPAHWREWLVQGFIDWRDEWSPAARSFADSPHVARCVEAIHKVIAKPALDEVAEAMRCIVAAEAERWSGPYTKKEYRDPIRGFFDDAKFFLSLIELRDGRDPLAEDWQWLRGPMRALLRLAQEFTAEFTRAKRAQGGVDFADLEQLALQLLVDASGEPTEIARIWQQRFEYVFVDECQDINAAQDAIIRAVSRDVVGQRCPQRAGEGQPMSATSSTLPGALSTASPYHTGNRFLVGDVKQSIYRFRLADPSIFRRYEEQWCVGAGGARIPLADNFRSREGILNFINPLFAALMRSGIGGVPYDADAQLRFGVPAERVALSAVANPEPRVALHVIHKTSGDDAAANGEDDGFVSDDSTAGDEKTDATPVEDVLAIEKEARLVAQLIYRLRKERHNVWDEDLGAMRPVQWRDMVVLLRSPSSRVETFAKEFSRAGVPLAAARAGFYSALEVQDLINLLRLLDNFLQDIPLAAVLCSPLVALSPDELAAVRLLGANADKRATFVSAVNHFYYKAPRDGLAAAGSARAKLKQFYESFGRWRTLVRQTSVSHCLEKVLAETHYEALLLAQPRGRERVANVRRLLELARQYDPFQRQGLYRFLRFIDEQQDAELDEEAATVETTDAVRLMSIHKSKGLEFPVVVIACLAAPFNMRDLREDILLNGEFGLCPKIVPPHVEQRYPSLPWWLAKRRETRELLGEEMRLLYVAMTRARDTILLTAFDKSKNAGTRWHLGPAELDDRAMLKSQSYFGWLRRWLGANSSDLNWANEREGASEWLRWELHQESGDEFTRSAAIKRPATAAAESQTGIDIDSLKARLTWKYPFEPATKEPAKTNVSALRRRAAEEDDEARQLFVPRHRGRRHGVLTAEEIGTAHHLFMQRAMFERTGSALDLRNQAERLVQEGFLTTAEAASLDYDALLTFWTSEFGRRVVTASHLVHRELPFTARFSIGELRALGFNCADVPPDEFAVVQGIVDLALIDDEGIEILDFKTDRVRAGETRERLAAYTPQIRLYAAALRAIYDRPVRRASLHFLATGETLPISVR